MIYLDTHVVVWLYAGLIDKLSDHAQQLIEENELVISPILQLELSYLHETKRIHYSSDVVVSELQASLGLKICDASFEKVVDKAKSLTWTRDPFDRLIVAQAQYKTSKLVTKDQTIRKHFRQAVWD